MVVEGHVSGIAQRLDVCQRGAYPLGNAREQRRLASLVAGAST